MSEALIRIVAAIEAYTGKPAIKTGLSCRLTCTHSDASGRNLMVSDGDGRVIMTCYSKHCDPKEILERVGLKIADVYHEPLNKKERKTYRKQANTRQRLRIFQNDLSCLSSWATMQRNGDDLSNRDKLTTKQAFIRTHIMFKAVEGLL